MIIHFSDRMFNRTQEESDLLWASVSFTTFNGVPGDTYTVFIDLRHGDELDFSDATTFTSASHTFTWMANGTTDWMLPLENTLESAKKYIHIRAKLTQTGKVYINPQTCRVTLKTFIENRYKVLGAHHRSRSTGDI